MLPLHKSFHPLGSGLRDREHSCAATSYPAVQGLGHLALWQAQLSSRDTPGVLGLASCGLASTSLPCGSHFPPSPLDLLELEAFHGLSLPQAPGSWKGRRGMPPLASCERARAQRWVGLRVVALF